MMKLELVHGDAQARVGGDFGGHLLLLLAQVVEALLLRVEEVRLAAHLAVGVERLLVAVIGVILLGQEHVDLRLGHAGVIGLHQRVGVVDHLIEGGDGLVRRGGDGPGLLLVLDGVAGLDCINVAELQVIIGQAEALAERGIGGECLEVGRGVFVLVDFVIRQRAVIERLLEEELVVRRRVGRDEFDQRGERGDVGGESARVDFVPDRVFLRGGKLRERGEEKPLRAELGLGIFRGLFLQRSDGLGVLLAKR